ncbi:MAG: twitching motility protein PilT, partial [Planctomycetia bacterium]|nr:twitching motility protein PilT [Planctomycetia bacterium]
MATIESSTKGVRPATEGASSRREVDRLFEALVRLQGSDLHLKVGQPPFMRVKGALQPLKSPKIDDEQMKRLCLSMLDDRQLQILEKDGGCDFAYTVPVDEVKWRFRVNLLYQQGSLGLVARRVNNKIPDFKGLYLPPAIERLCHLDQGMV